MKRWMLPAVLALSASFSGCSATGPAFKPESAARAGEATLYVYRPKTHALSALSAVIEVDGVRYAAIGNNGYVAIPVRAGTHAVTQTWKGSVLTNSDLQGKPIVTSITTSEGIASYVRLESYAASTRNVEVSGNLNIHADLAWRLREVDAATALPEIASCRQARLGANQ